MCGIAGWLSRLVRLPGGQAPRDERGLKALELIRRAAGKSPGYVARRGLREVSRRIRSRGFRRKLDALSAAAVAREGGANSLEDLWRRDGPNACRLDPAAREEIRALYRGPYALEGSRLSARVERILAHEFDLLGSGPTRLSTEIDWHCDFKSGYRWELAPSEGIDCADLERESDVKVPWELSRGQHLTTLARSWVVHGDERCAPEFERQVLSWIRSNPVGMGVNWACTMDVALRAVSWIWALGLFEGAPFSQTFREEILFSLYQHGLWIPEHLEYAEVNGNHFLSDALGLVACGAVFRQTPEGSRWLDTGTRLLEKEILEQVEEDGVDIEASVPYHRLVLEIFLVGARFLEAAGQAPPPEYHQRLEAMLNFVHSYVTPEGLSPVVGDADDGRALILGETDVRDHRYLLSTGSVLFRRSDWKSRAGKFWEDSLWLLGPAGRRAFETLPSNSTEESLGFPASGFYVLRSARHYLFVDVGPVGFRGRGGHGHNDCLSFEWHPDGKPLLTDSGTFVYTPSPQWRNLFRSTESHNTIRVDGEEINRFPSALALWSLRNDARPVEVRFEADAARDLLHAGHTGYERLSDPVRVFRTFEFDRSVPRLRLTDRLEGKASHLVEFFFHVAPGVRVARAAGNTLEIVGSGQIRARIDQESGPEIAWEQKQGWFSPSYGVKVERPVWVASAKVKLPFEIVWNLTVGG